MSMVSDNIHFFCSTIIPTVGRLSLFRAVESVLSQEFTSAGFEVIVVNDSGQPLPGAGWQQSDRVRIIHTNRRERSVARNTGAAVARGRYLHFLDDDDWLAPGALQYFWALSQSSQAKWLYGVTQLVDRMHNPTIRLQHGLDGNSFIQFMAGEWIPLQSSLIEAQTFFEINGFNPLLTGPEDIDLLRRFGLVSEVAGTPHLVAFVVRGEEGSTTDYVKHQQASRWAREKILDSPLVYQAMRS
jgi:glycosyltransferase involved in cell wall biosynthesis